MSGRVLGICVDGSEVADNAFKFAIDNIYKEGDTVLIIHATEFHVSFGAGAIFNTDKIVEDCKKRDEECSALTAKYIDVLRKQNVNAQALRPAGSKPGEIICSSCVTAGVTHIVMGTRGLNKLQRALLGSVSQYVLNHSDIPVTIVPLKKK